MTQQDESKLIPILREGVEVIKMVFFQKMRSYLFDKYPGRDAAYISKLAGAVINELFDTPNTQEPFRSFAEENVWFIEEELKGIPANFEPMRIPLTDALRIQFLCDHQEGIDSSRMLARARDLGILMVERDVPLPAKFMALVRKLGSKFNIIVPE